MSENWKNGNNQDPKTAQTVHVEKTGIWVYGAERRGKPSVATYCVIAAADRGTEGGDGRRNGTPSERTWI